MHVLFVIDKDLNNIIVDSMPAKNISLHVELICAFAFCNGLRFKYHYCKRLGYMYIAYL